MGNISTLSSRSRSLVARAAAKERDAHKSLVVAQLFEASRVFKQSLDESLRRFPSTPAKRRFLEGAYKRGELGWLLQSGRITRQALDEVLGRK